jgi:serine O-acetyltransferase
VLRLYGADVPAGVRIGQDFQLHHRGLGVVIHHRSRIGDRVQVFQGVTIGKSDPTDVSYEFGGADIEDDVVLGAGCQILGNRNGIRVRRGTVIAGNSVLTQSTGAWEVWAGLPARKIRDRVRFEPQSTTAEVPPPS